uniref:Clp protease n=1 Tax=Lotharella vacuolata TaxID=74820 RepID=A0A0H5BH30_9EUKA|nr:clp protease [Lotharella vacuolata]
MILKYKSESISGDLRYYINKKKMLFLNGYHDISLLNIHIQTMLYFSLNNMNKKLNIFVNNFNTNNECLPFFLNNLHYIEKFYNTTGYGLITTHSLVILSGGMKNKRKVFPNTKIYLNYNNPLFLDKYKMFPMKSFENNYYFLFVNRIIRVNSKISNIRKRRSFTNTIDIYERNYFIPNLKAIEFGIIDSIFL